MNETRSSELLPGLFAKHGLRCTRQRRALYEALAATTSHPTADQLYREVAPRMKGMSLATVYNTLEALCEAGLAWKLPSATGSARYDATVANHLHLRCEKCGQLGDVPEDLSGKLLAALDPAVLKAIEEATGFEIRQVQIDLIGTHRDDKEESRPAESN